MNLKQVEAFRAAMITRKIVDAAKLLFVSQPSVTRLIQQLEEEVGFILFERSKSGITPTSEAVQFYEAVKTAFVGLDSLEATAKHIGALQAGELRIASPVAMSFGFIPHVVRVFKERYPEVQISLNTGLSVEIIAQASLQRYDVGIVIGSHGTTGGILEPFLDAQAVIILPLKHRLIEKSFVTPQDIEGEDFISLSDQDPSRKRFEQLLLREGVTTNTIIETLFSASICGFVSQNLGIAVVNPFTAHYFQNIGYTIRPFRPAISFENHLIYPAHQPRSLICKAFVEVLNECKHDVMKHWTLEES